MARDAADVKPTAQNSRKRVTQGHRKNKCEGRLTTQAAVGSFRGVTQPATIDLDTIPTADLRAALARRVGPWRAASFSRIERRSLYDKIGRAHV